ncbi:MAG: hypothetical protein COV66_13610 [Nitrospinae bacterium CG11_big_fil_rev_8_21_14_0_20_45_15]|nr:MAG: hypothetical protein COV66_13610 [Nitrospinae bacterium CG11_big_fil_rev_8_21_14_0_20_45_15]
MKEFKDYYLILNVVETADAVEIKKNYRKLALEFHPDHNRGAPEAEEKFKGITEAYGVLIDPVKRRKYDRFRRDHLSGARSGNSGFSYSQEEIFENMFRDGFARDIFEELNREFQNRGFRSGQSFFGPLFFGSVGGLGRVLSMIPGPIGAIGRGLRIAHMVGASIMAINSMRQKSNPPHESEPKNPESGNPGLFDFLKGSIPLAQSSSKPLDFNYSITIPHEEIIKGVQKMIRYQCDGKSEAVLVKIPPNFSHGGRLRLSGKGRKENDQQGDLILTVYSESK